jgi:hypothetical protein
MDPSTSSLQDIISYITSCIQPRSNLEYNEIDTFDQTLYDNMKQDAILLVKNNTIPILKGRDYLTINNNVILRKNYPLELEWLHKDGSIHFAKNNDPIYMRLQPPPLETVNHTFLISKIISATNKKEDNAYIEYGVRSGENLETISKLVNRSYGVDIQAYTPKSLNINFFKMSTDAFSTSVLPHVTYDYAFIDADHTCSQVVIDFDYLYKYINKGGYIFLHDTYPCREDLLQPCYCNNCYLTPIKIREKYPDIEMITLPLNPGLTVIRKN